MRVIVGLDAGNNRIKLVGQFGPLMFLSNICDYAERNVDELNGPDDMIFCINGRKGFAGTLAAREDEFNGNMFGDSKAHEDAKIRVLLALHRYCKDGDEVYLVTGQPIKKHIKEEKEKIKNMLMGMHTIEINGQTKKIFVGGVEVAPEGSAAFWSNPQNGHVRIIDCGSGTVNMATIDQNKMHVNKDSTTLDFGIETINQGLESMARGIIRHTSKKWKKSDCVLVCGGVAELLTPYLQTHFNNCQVLRPILKTNNTIKQLHPIYANATGYFELAKKRFNQ